MTYLIDFLDVPITCHCWNYNATQIALYIYSISRFDKELKYTLNKHSSVIYILRLESYIRPYYDMLKKIFDFCMGF